MPESGPSERLPAAEPYFPSQPPYQFYDRLLSRTDTASQVVKNITRNEWCLVRNPDGDYYFPASMLLECMAQAAGTFDEYLQQRVPPKKIFLSAIKGVEIRRLPIPGDQLIITAHFVKALEAQVLYEVETSLDQQVIAHASFYFARL